MKTYKKVELTFTVYGEWFDHVRKNMRISAMADNKIVSDAGVLDSGWVNNGTTVKV